MKKTIWTVALLSLLSIEAFAGVRFVGVDSTHENRDILEPIAKCNMLYMEKREYYLAMKRYAEATGSSSAYYFLALVKIHGKDYRYKTLSCAKRYAKKAMENADEWNRVFYTRQYYMLKNCQDLESAQRVIAWVEPGGDCPKVTVIKPKPKESRPPVETGWKDKGYAR